MATEHLRLRKTAAGYFCTEWVDELGGRHKRTFGNVKKTAENRFSAFHHRWKNDRGVRTPGLAVKPMTIREGWEKFKAHAQAYYRRADGTPTGEAENFEHAFAPVLDMHGDSEARTFGPKALKDVRHQMVLAGICRNTINARVRKVRHVFKWLASEELLTAEVYHSLQAVPALSKHRAVIINGEEHTPAESAGVKPVPDAHVWAIINAMPRTISAMIEFEYLTGARPGEVCNLRPVDIDCSGKIWLATLIEHKTAHHGKARVIPIGPKAQAIIQPFMARPVDQPLFSPAEAIEQRGEKARAEYKPISGKGDYRKWASYQERERTPREVGDRYTPRAYARLIARACKALEVPHWHPNQLRHNAATRLRKQFGLDVAGAALGHSSLKMTEVYAELDMEKAVRAMEMIG